LNLLALAVDLQKVETVAYDHSNIKKWH